MFLAYGFYGSLPATAAVRKNIFTKQHSPTQPTTLGITYGKQHSPTHPTTLGITYGKPHSPTHPTRALTLPPATAVVSSYIFIKVVTPDPTLPPATVVRVRVIVLVSF